MKIFKSPYGKIIFVISIIMLIIIGLKFLNIDFSNVNENDFKNWVKSLGPWSPLVYIVIYILRPLILFPAGVLSATAGIIWGHALGFFYLQIAANISATAEFFIARYFAREAVGKFLKGKVERIDERIEKHGFITVLLIRLIPNAPWDVQNLSLGLTKVKFKDYFLATLIGIMPGSFAFVFFGSSLIKVLFDPKNLWMIGVGILIFIGIFQLQKYLKKRSSQKN